MDPSDDIISKFEHKECEAECKTLLW